jgi:hypothetical protein
VRIEPNGKCNFSATPLLKKTAQRLLSSLRLPDFLNILSAILVSEILFLRK